MLAGTAVAKPAKHVLNSMFTMMSWSTRNQHWKGEAFTVMGKTKTRWDAGNSANSPEIPRLNRIQKKRIGRNAKKFSVTI